MSKEPFTNPYLSGHPALTRTQLSPPRRVRQGLKLLHSDRRLFRISLRRAAMFSGLAHLLGPLALTAFLLLILQIPIWDWFAPKNKPADLTFDLVSETHASPPEKPLFKGNANQRAGGKKTPDPKPSAAHQAGGSGKRIVSKQPTPKLSPVISQAPPKPVSKPSIVSVTPVETPVSPAIAVPVEPKIAMDTQPMAEPGVTGGSPTGSETGQGIASGGTGIGNANGAGVGEGALGSAQGGDGPDGVDVAEDADFGPFLAELKRRIYRHWIPPRRKSGQQVLLLLYLARDGQLVKIETKKTSGDEETDQAAIAAVQASMPFIPFPPRVKEDVLPIEWTFDYNIFKPRDAKRGLKW